MSGLDVELLPCAICGDEPREWADGFWHIDCKRCSYEIEDYALGAWSDLPSLAASEWNEHQLLELDRTEARQ